MKTLTIMEYFRVEEDLAAEREAEERREAEEEAARDRAIKAGLAAAMAAHMGEVYGVEIPVENIEIRDYRKEGESYVVGSKDLRLIIMPPALGPSYRVEGSDLVSLWGHRFKQAGGGFMAEDTERRTWGLAEYVGLSSGILKDFGESLRDAIWAYLKAK